MEVNGVKGVRSVDRVLVLEPIDGKSPLSSTGMVDPRLFTGENKLHAIKDEQTALWHFKYDMGVLPPQLKQEFTGFPKLKTFADNYFKKRNIQIKEVLE